MCTAGSAQTESVYEEAMLAGDDCEPYESAEKMDADDWLRLGGDSDGVRDGAREELLDDAA